MSASRIFSVGWEESFFGSLVEFDGLDEIMVTRVDGTCLAPLCYTTLVQDRTEERPFRARWLQTYSHPCRQHAAAVA